MLERAAILLFALLCLGGALGCEHVKPWEKDVLARPDMAWSPNGIEDEMRGTIFMSKEASLGGGGAGGGGCGCN